MRNVEQQEDARELGLPAAVQEALGEFVSAAKDGLLALSVGVGLGVLETLMEEEVTEVVGLKGARGPDRVAVRHGREAGDVTLGGRRVAVERPRVRAGDGSGEVSLATYAHFANRDPLTRVVLEQMLAGVSTRRFARTREPVGQDVVDAERSTSKSALGMGSKAPSPPGQHPGPKDSVKPGTAQLLSGLEIRAAFRLWLADIDGRLDELLRERAPPRHE